MLQITCPEGLPKDLDYISIDGYGNASNSSGEVYRLRRFYPQYIYPLLRSHQRVFTVPGFMVKHRQTSMRTVSFGGCAIHNLQNLHVHTGCLYHRLC